MKIQGVCNHHDLGALGAAVNRRATERQLEIMKGGGRERHPHQPQSAVARAARMCDRMGLLVMDESFDMWRIPKVPQRLQQVFRRMVGARRARHGAPRPQSSEHHHVEHRQRDPRAGARRRRGDGEAADRSSSTRRIPRAPRRRRSTTGPNAIKNGLADEVDFPGFNYKPMHYEQILKEHPNWIIYGSETASCVSSRGVYHLPIDEVRESIRRSSSPATTSSRRRGPTVPTWSSLTQDKLPEGAGRIRLDGLRLHRRADAVFRAARRHQTDWPARSSYFGMVDLAGFPKDRYYLYQSEWTKKPMVHVLPHWNWAGREGQNIPVMAYTNADEVELFLNGKSLGRKKRFSEPVEMPVGPNVSPDRKFLTKYRLEWQVPYQPGQSESGGVRGRQAGGGGRRSHGGRSGAGQAGGGPRRDPGRWRRPFVRHGAGGRQGGNLCPMADNLVQFESPGPGQIAARGQRQCRDRGAVPGRSSQGVQRAGAADCPLSQKDKRDESM